MNTRFWSLLTGFILAGLLASAPAAADVSWTGPGWYVEGSATGLDLALISGPYSSKDDCIAAQPADDNEYMYNCEYETSDPTADGG